MDSPLVPYRGVFGADRPARLAGLALPNGRMPNRRGLRPLKSWRYVGVYGDDLMLCVGSVRVGPGRQTFWAVWDRAQRKLHGRTSSRRGGVEMPPGRVVVRDGEVEIDLVVEEGPGIETICPSGAEYGWTRKQGGVPVRGFVRLGAVELKVDGRGVVDDSAGYHQRHTVWSWSAGVGVAVDGRDVAWNLVSGINDPPVDSERTVWIDGVAAEVGPNTFAADLSSVSFAEGGALQFTEETVREANDNRLLLRSRYRQPFGTFSGELPGGVQLAEGFGVMEAHDVWW